MNANTTEAKNIVNNMVLFTSPGYDPWILVKVCFFKLSALKVWTNKQNPGIRAVYYLVTFDRWIGLSSWYVWDLNHFGSLHK